MPTQFDKINSLLRKITLVLVALGFVMVTAQAQTGDPTETIVPGRPVTLGLIQGETLRYTAFNPSETDAGKPNESISLQLKLYDKNGAVIAVSPKVVIPPGEFRSVEFNRDALTIPGEPGTTRAQIRTQALWGLRSKSRFNVSISLEVLNNNTAGTFKFFYNIETLP